LRKLIKSRRAISRIAIAVVAIVVIVGAAIAVFYLNTSSKPLPKPLSTLTLGLDLSPDRLNPYARGLEVRIVLGHVYEQLVRYEGDVFTEVKPALATSWEQSADGMYWTFHLRQGVKFYPSGDPFNATCVKYSLDMLHEEGLGALYLTDAYNYTEIVNDYTVRIHLKHPTPYYLYALAFGAYGAIVNPKFVEAHGGYKKGEWNLYLSQHVDGTGPYTVEEFASRDHVVLVKNPNYWGGWEGKHVDRILVRQIAEAATRLMLLGRGDLDVAYIPVSYLPELKSRITSENLSITVYDSWNGKSIPGFQIMWVAFQNLNFPTNETNVRKAIACAIDRETIIKNVYYGYADPLYNWIPQGFLGYDPTIPRYEFNLTKAAEYLAKASPGAQTYLKEHGIDYLFWIGSTLGRDGAIIAKAGLEKIGIKVNLREVTFAQFKDIAFNPNPDPTLQMYDTYWGIDVPDPSNLMMEIWGRYKIEKHGWSQVWAATPETDALIEEAALTTNTTRRIELYRQIQMWTYETCPVAFFAQPQGVGMRSGSASQNNVKGFIPSPVNSLQMWFYWVYKE
jgi:peptide/nickel transport system substrate-binding protein